MKKLFLLPFLLFTFVLQAYSFQWTDDNGVTWSIGQKDFKAQFNYSVAERSMRSAEYSAQAIHDS